MKANMYSGDNAHAGAFRCFIGTKAKAEMECYLLAQERWYDFMLDCMTACGVMKRP